MFGLLYCMSHYTSLHQISSGSEADETRHGIESEPLSKLFIEAHTNATLLSKNLTNVHWAQMDFAAERITTTKWIVFRYVQLSLFISFSPPSRSCSDVPPIPVLTFFIFLPFAHSILPKPSLDPGPSESKG